MIYLLKGDIEVRPTALGKITTVFQMLTIISVLLQFIYSMWIWNIAVLFTVISGLDYLRIGTKQFNEKLQ
jgi:phosphatidylglycerophosphate synthase